ncbi:MAG: acyl-CoA dehydratase activase [Lachnospiraceae bacterium]|nr:acyl-CoA dehydratase activase [Lachnospiraceae bacterium]
MPKKPSDSRMFLVGIDVGSTTTKIVVTDSERKQIVYSDYKRHNAAQVHSVCLALDSFMEKFPNASLRLALTGSGGGEIAKRLGVPYIQEVVANSIALRSYYTDVGTAIELGGQDAKMIFFHRDTEADASSGSVLKVSDMRMNGSCAGGTGAFIDEIATVLKTPVEEFNALAEQGTCVYDISGRCGVYAKTDIQPLLNQGVARADLALSAFHAIAKQTIGGLAQGLDIEKPVVFEGGPLTFNPRLIGVFAERLGLRPEDTLIPEHPEIMIAYGASLSLESMFAARTTVYTAEELRGRLEAGAEAGKTRDADYANAVSDRTTGSAAAEADTAHPFSTGGAGYDPSKPFFASEEEHKRFLARHVLKECVPYEPHAGETVHAYLGIDSGSTTTKFVLMDEQENILDSFYSPNEGEPLMVAKKALLAIRDRYRSAGATLDIIAAGSTGYGELLVSKAWNTECHMVETVAHARAAAKYVDDATFILDIGGQDMKAIWVDHGIVTNIVVNEACSSGCGSFLENFASSLHIPVKEIARTAFESKHPAVLGSRCTVFMNSSIVTEQRNGKQSGDIMAGLCRSIIENVFTKVIRISNLDSLGDTIVVQGGTFQNDAVLCALEQYTGREVTRAPYPGLMGAIGAALLTKEHCEEAAAERIDRLERAASQTKSDGRLERAASQTKSDGRLERVASQAENDGRLERVASQAENDDRLERTASQTKRGAEAATAGKKEEAPFPRTFIGLDELEQFSYTQEANSPCPFCTNHCKRTIVRFSNGNSWITNNRCERGEILGDPKDASVREQLKEKKAEKDRVPNLFRLREELLFREYPHPNLYHPSDTEKTKADRSEAQSGYSQASDRSENRKGQRQQDAAPDRGITIGIPRVLSFWETMPFWTTFWKSLGFRVKISDKSTRKIYESGLSAVTSDTVCFPAKLVHGHIRNLVEYAKKMDAGVSCAQQTDLNNAACPADKPLSSAEPKFRIFMPSITKVSSENTEKTSESMCAVVKGYPIVIRNSDNPEKRWNIPFDAPLFHWHKTTDRNCQLTEYMEQTFGIPEELTMQAIAAGDAAQETFSAELKKAGQEVIDQVEKEGSYAVVLASRPYQNDALVNHDLPEMFTSQGIPVLTADSVPGIDKVDLSHSRLDIVNNYHARMLSTAILAAQSKHLEYVQIVSFGCGHDAYLSDEIIRMMKEISGKIPLVLKVDESDIQGPLRIRVRSFVETVAKRRRKQQSLQVHELSDPYPVKFTKADRKEKILLVPNTSHAFARLMAAAMGSQHNLRAEALENGREEAIRLGKQYVHNDICFPAQIVIGEALAALRSGKYGDKEVVIAMAKYVGDCRLTHYSALLRKALDDAGYAHVPILTNDDVDSHNLHPGYKLSLLASIKIAFCLPMIDELEELLRKIRPYEKEPGSANRAFEAAIDELIFGLEKHGLNGARHGFKKGIELMKNIDYDRSRPKPRVLIVGEYLLNFHPGANHDIEDYLEKNGFEIIEARMTDVIQKTYFYQDAQNKEYHLDRRLTEKAWPATVNEVFDLAHSVSDSIACTHPLYERPARLPELVKDSDPIIHHTFDAGEGVLIPGEILHHAKKGCRSFVILQPFGCLPNHVVGRGIAKKLKEIYPDAQILPLDYDPDVSFANIENRLQMLIMNAKGDSHTPEMGRSAKEEKRGQHSGEFATAH